MPRRFVLSALSLGVAILLFCPHAEAQKTPPDKGTQAALPTKPAAQLEESAADREQQSYQRAKDMLEFFKLDLLARQKQIARELVGKECAPPILDWGCERVRTVTQEDVEKVFRDGLKELNEQLAALEAEHNERLRSWQASPCPDCEVFYIRSAESYWSATQLWPGIAFHVLYVSAERVNQKLDNERQAFVDGLGSDLPSDQRDANIKRFDDKQSAIKKEVFDRVAKEFRRYVLLLSDDRKKLVGQLLCEQDLARQFSKRKGDKYGESADMIGQILVAYDTGNLGFTTTGGQLYLQAYNDEPWCRQRPYKDIQDTGSCGLLSTNVMAQLPVAKIPRIKDCDPEESARKGSKSTVQSAQGGRYPDDGP